MHPPKVFRGYRKNEFAVLAKKISQRNFHLFYTYPENFSSGLGQITEIWVIYDAMFGRNRWILRSIVSGWVSLFSGVCVCIACNIIGVSVYLGAIYSCPRVKVTQGHACHGPFPWLISTVIIRTLQYPEPRGHCLKQILCQLWNERLRSDYIWSTMY